MGTPFLTLYDEQGNPIPIPSVRGPEGPQGPQGPAGGTAELNDEEISASKLWSSQKTKTEIETVIDDTAASTEKTWSSSKISGDLAEVTSGVVTSDYTGFVNKQVKYKVKNKIVVLSGYFDVTEQLPSNGVIFNNLPGEVNDEVVMVTFGKLNSTNIYTGRMPIAGKVYLDSAIPVGTDYYVQATYFTK